MSEFDDDETPDGEMTAAEEAIAASLSQEAVARIDAALLANAQPHARKVAMIVVLTMMEPGLRVPGLPDLFYRNRVRELVKAGQLAADGNLDYMRFSEVRRPSALTPNHSFKRTPDGAA